MLAKIVWYKETKTPLLEEKFSAQLEIYNGAAIYLLHGGEDILTVKNKLNHINKYEKFVPKIVT